VSRGDRTEPEDDDLSAAPGAAEDSLEAMLHKAIAAPLAYPALEAGAVVAEHYVIERMLGAGGMGTVYLARDTRLDREATVEQRAAAFRKRFERAKSQLRELAVKHGLIPED
jgi:serine/threonine protein kinase